MLMFLAGGFAEAWGQSLTAPYQVLGAGGGKSTNARFAIHGTIGQPANSGSTNAAFAVRGGFWPASQVLHPPRFLEIGTQQVREDDVLRDLHVIIEDYDSPDSLLRIFDVSSASTAILAPDGIEVRGRLVSLRPVTNAFGRVEVRLRVEDEDGRTDATEFGLEVTPVNDPPGFVLTTQRIIRCGGGGLQSVPDVVRSIVPGPLNELQQGLSFEVEGWDPTLLLEAPRLGRDGTLVFAPRPGAAGTNRLVVALRDDGGVDDGGRDRSGPVALDLVLSSVPTLTQALPPSRTVREGESLELRVGAESSFGVAYRWSLNGVRLSSETGPALRIGVARPHHTGRYSVEVLNPCGSTRSEVLLTVLPAERPPSIVGEPPDTEVGECGEELVLRVDWVGSEPARFQWRVNGENIEDGPVADSACAGTRVIGARSNVLRILQPDRQFGGLYTVAVENGLGTVESRPAVIRMGPGSRFGALPATDRIGLPGVAALEAGGGAGYASNRGVAADPGSGFDVGAPAAHALWFKWIAPAGNTRARVTLRTAGSTFDTLLAVATNLPPTGKPWVVDGEGGRFHTSRVQFVYEPGQTYFIYVDGVDGGTGDVLLSWDVEAGPAILSPPRDQVLRLAETDTAEFEVTAQDSEGGDAVLYQWEVSSGGEVDFFTLEGETNAMLRVVVTGDSIRESVRFYRVVVRDRANPGRASVTSTPALLEVVEGAVPWFAGTFDRTSDAIRSVSAGGALAAARGSGTRTLAGVGSAGVGAGAGGRGVHSGQSTAAGRIHTHNRLSTHERGERNHGGIIGGRSRWFVLQPETGGLLRIDTENSEVPTVIVVYEYQTEGGVLTRLTEVARSDALNPGGPPYAIVRLFVPDPVVGRPRPSYLVVIDTPGAVSGKLQINLPEDAIPIDEGFRWVSFRPGVDDTISIDLEDNGLDRVYFIFTGLSYDTLFEQVFLDDAGEDGVQRVVNFPAVANAVYLIALDRKEPGPDVELRFTTPLRISSTPDGKLRMRWKAAGYDLASSDNAVSGWQTVEVGPTAGVDGSHTLETRIDVRAPRFFRLIPRR